MKSLVIILCLLRSECTVLVAGKRITAVGPADQVRIPDDADLVDAAGGFLIPGLWDMHVHSVANVALDPPRLPSRRDVVSRIEDQRLKSRNT